MKVLKTEKTKVRNKFSNANILKVTSFVIHIGAFECMYIPIKDYSHFLI